MARIFRGRNLPSMKVSHISQLGEGLDWSSFLLINDCRFFFGWFFFLVKGKKNKIITSVLRYCSAPHLSGNQIISALGCEDAFLSLLQGGSNCLTSPGQKVLSWQVTSIGPPPLILPKLCHCTAGNAALFVQWGKGGWP